MHSTQQIVRRYFDARTSGDLDTVTTLLAPDLTFSAGDLKIDGRGAFLDAGAFPRDARAGAGTEGRQGGGRG